MSSMSSMSSTGLTSDMNPPVTDTDALVSLAQSVLRIEADAISALQERINADFVKACHLLLACEGRIMVCGIGKSGHIGAKLAATFASTGSPAFFVHAAEASHGDLGMFKSNDTFIGISYSGNSAELMAMIPGIKRLGMPIISLCAEPASPLAKASDIVLDTRVEKEACPLGLAPTASTTATLALGDALAIALLSARGFTEEDFARSHPGGRLGRRLLLTVDDVMHKGDALPVCNDSATLAEALVEISKKGLGMVTILNPQGHLTGIFTDGDLRRTFERSVDIRTLNIKQVMTQNPATIDAQTLAINAVSKMQQLKITSLPVVNEHCVVGVITMHALLGAGVV